MLHSVQHSFSAVLSEETSASALPRFCKASFMVSTRPLLVLLVCGESGRSRSSASSISALDQQTEPVVLQAHGIPARFLLFPNLDRLPHSSSASCNVDARGVAPAPVRAGGTCVFMGAVSRMECRYRRNVSLLPKHVKRGLATFSSCGKWSGVVGDTTVLSELSDGEELDRLRRNGSGGDRLLSFYGP